MKKGSIIFIYCLFALHANAQQNVGIGTNNPHIAAALEISSSNKGLLPPRITAAKKIAISNPPKGLMVFDTNTSSYWYYTDGGWKEVQSSFLNRDSSLVMGKVNPALPSNNMPATNVRASITVDTSGYIYDSGGPSGNYAANENRELTVFPLGIDEAAAIGVKLSLMSGLMENAHDTLFVLDAAGDTILRITGTIVPATVYLNGDRFTLLSKTDAAVNESGFQLRYDFIYTVPAQQGINELSGLHYLPSRFALRGGFDGTSWKQPDSIGLFSLAYGRANKATNSFSLSVGDNNIASGIAAITVGTKSISSGSASMAFGNRARATQDNAIAIGSFAKALGNGAVSIGYNNTASGDNATSIGTLNNASGYSSAAIGRVNEASGDYAFATGNVTTAAGVTAFATGGSTLASGDYAASFGLGTIAQSYAALVAGRYNVGSAAYSGTSWVGADPLLILGNGASPLARSNAFSVLKNANTGINVPVPQAALHIKGTTATFDSHLRLETFGSSTDYMNLSYDGSTKFKNFGADDEYQFRNDENLVICRMLDNGNMVIAGTLTQNSDARLKKNIHPLQNSLQKIGKINGYHYTWRDTARAQQLQSGLLAQEVEQQMPELVSKGEEGISSVNYSGLIPYLVEAMKELKAENEQLKNEIDALKKRIQP